MRKRTQHGWRRWWLLGLVVVGLLWQPLPTAAGGWLTCTLEALPADPTVGQEQVIRFSLRQHGQHLIERAARGVDFTHPASGERLTVPAEDEPGRPGYYRAVVTLPQPGLWQWTIRAWAEHPMPPLTVGLPATALATPPAPAPAAASVDRATADATPRPAAAGTGLTAPVGLLALAIILAAIGLGCLLRPVRTTGRAGAPARGGD